MQMFSEERVLLLAPTSVDAALSRSILGDAGLVCLACDDLQRLAHELGNGAGAILLTEEILRSPDMQHLLDALRNQPPWSDVPIVLLSASDMDSSPVAWAIDLLGNVTVLERPVRVTNLVSALHTAVRARKRQYQLRTQLTELKQAESALRKQNERQQLLWEAASVLLTTEEPDAMMQALFAKLAPHLDLDMYFNFSVNDSGDGLRLGSCIGISSEDAEKINRLEFDQAIRGTVAMNIQQSDEPRTQLMKSQGIRAYTFHPLMAEGRLIGTLSFASHRRSEFAKDELEFLRTIRHYVAVAYERANLIRQLRDIDRRKDEFLATLAHELRNPLAPIRNALEILRMTDNNGATIEHVRAMMERQLGQMVRLIDDLLDVSRITRGKLTLRRERVELASIVEYAIDTTRPLIDSFQHELSVTLPHETVTLDADPMRLAQVFANLLNNAAKYTDPHGHIWLTAVRRGQELVVTVRDTGVGIPTEILPSIFDMFTQGDRSLEKSQGGLGIGLTLVKRLVEMHGGTVDAHSEGTGKGTEFVVSLPVVSEAAPSSLPDPYDSPSTTSTVVCRILVADDNHDAVESMGEMLRLMGHDVRTVHDGIEALETASTFRPDVVFLDIGMPRMNGYDAARLIRAQPWGMNIVLVALTGWGQDEDKRKATEAGFDWHFTKPIKLADLERLVSSLPCDAIHDRTTDATLPLISH